MRFQIFSLGLLHLKGVFLSAKSFLSKENVDSKFKAVIRFIIIHRFLHVDTIEVRLLPEVGNSKDYCAVT